MPQTLQPDHRTRLGTAGSAVIRAALLALVLAAACAPAGATVFGLLPGHRAELAPPPVPGARAWLLMEPLSGEILAAANERDALAPASLTKLMTAYVVFDAIRQGRHQLDERATISERAWRTGGSRTFLELGDAVSLEQLLRGLLIQSGNDAAVALAEHVGDTVEGFAEQMNAAATRLGMADSRFANPHGLPARGHYSSARDLGLLARALILEFPDHYHIFGESMHTHNGITQYSRNRLMRRDDSVDGLKTGYTRDAGYCVVNSSLRDGLRMISVVLGSSSPEQRFEESQALLDWGHDQLRLQTLVEAEHVLAVARVWGADGAWLPLALGQDLRMLVPAHRAVAVDIRAEAQEFELDERIEIGDSHGRVRVRVDGVTVLHAPLQARTVLERAGFFARAADGARRLLRDWGWLSDRAYADEGLPQ